jgi:hypothetical protein
VTSGNHLIGLLKADWVTENVNVTIIVGCGTELITEVQYWLSGELASVDV